MFLGKLAQIIEAVPSEVPRGLWQVPDLPPGLMHIHRILELVRDWYWFYYWYITELVLVLVAVSIPLPR